jgi:hypothetical protein
MLHFSTAAPLGATPRTFQPAFTIGDEFSRESVALEVERRMESADVIRILDAAVAERGTAPDFIRSGNGPEFIAAAVQTWIQERGFKTLYIAPGSPRENLQRELQQPFSGRVPEPGELCLPAGSQSTRQGVSARLQPSPTALLAGLSTPGEVRVALPCGGFRYAPVAARQRPLHRPHHHQPTTRQPTKSLTASGSNFGGRPV